MIRSQWRDMLVLACAALLALSVGYLVAAYDHGGGKAPGDTWLVMN